MALRTLLLAAVLVAVPSLAAAGTLTGLTVDPTSTRVGFPVNVQVTSVGPRCGVRVLPGDGRSFDVRVNGTRALQFPYAAEGDYQVQAVGRRKGDTPACKGTVAPVQVEVKPPLVAGPKATNGGLKPVTPPPPGGGSGSFQRAPDTPRELEVIPIEVKALVIHPYASIADVTVSLNLPKAEKVELFLTRNGEQIKRQWFDVQNGQTLGLDGVVPGAHHQLKVRATNKGTTGEKTTSFRAKRRQVEVVITSVFAVDDGDNIDAGDFRFSFYLNGRNEPAMSFSHDIDTGTGVQTNHRGVVGNAIASPYRFPVFFAEHDNHQLPQGWGTSDQDKREISFNGVDSRTGGTVPLRFDAKGDEPNIWHVRLEGHANVTYVD